MAILRIGDHEEYTFDPILLAHIQYVIVSKFLKKESFLFSWREFTKKTSIWLHPGIDISFTYREAIDVPLNYSWIDAMLKKSNEIDGLSIVIDSEIEHSGEISVKKGEVPSCPIQA